MTIVGITGHYLHSVIWEAIKRVEKLGLHVIALICDGAKPNRKFFRDHYDNSLAKDNIVYKVPNLFRPGSYIYFISDVPHLMKTSRNAWENSKKNGTRKLWVKHYNS